MKINEFISRLRSENVRLKVNGNDLTVSAQNGALNEALLQELKERKPQIVAYLQSTQANQAFESIPLAKKQENYPLSYAQQRLWIHNEFTSSHVVYNMLSAIRLRGHLNVDAFRRAFASLIKRHEVLRTAIISKEGQPVQLIHDDLTVDWVYGLLTDDASQEETVNRLIEESVQRKFDLAEAPLLRMQLFKLNNTEHVMLLNIHHLIADGWSINILLKDLVHYYRAHSGEAAMRQLPRLKVQYKDFVLWQQRMLLGMHGQTLKEFWSNYLRGELPVLRLPYDHPRPVVRGNQGSTFSVVFDSALAIELRQLSKQQGVSLFMLMCAMAKLLFHRYSQQRDIIIGTTMGGREHADLENLAGLFINAIPIRTQLDPKLAFEEFLQKVRVATTQAFEHKAYPFDLMVKDLNLERDPGRHPIFDVMVIMENMEMHQQDFGAIEMTSIPVQKGISKFDLTLIVKDGQDELGFALEYNTDLFEPATVHRMAQHYITLCKSAVSSPKTAIGQLNLLPADEVQWLNDFKQTDTPVAGEASIIRLFEDMAGQYPNATAIRTEEGTVTYQELNEKANKLASYLDELEIGEGDYVGLHLERGEPLIVSMLGVMKSGAAFVPLDTSQQGERLTYMVQDSGMELLILQSHLVDNVSGAALDIMVIDEHDLEGDWLEGYGTDNPQNELESEQSAYVIYTSGSTGKPKGCAISHGNFLNYINWANKFFFQEEEQGNFGLFTSISFDFTLTGIFSPLTRGRLLYIFPPQQEIHHTLQQVFHPENPIDCVKLTPSHVALLEEARQDTNIRTVILGGEALKEVHIRKLMSIDPNMRLINEYGPTEATVGCIAKSMSLDEPILIGKPIDNTRIYILDEQQQPVPIGVEGELCIAGAGVGLGYIHQEELTAQKFLDNPFEPAGKLYRSGDKARWLATGEIEYLGRLDEQVKIRGHRVEPGEIEQQLVKHEQVAEAVVLAKLDEIGNTYLDAYIDAKSGLDVVTLRNFLSQLLPEHMIPAHFISVDQIPLTSNGKADRKALLELQENAMSLGSKSEAPRTAQESLLVQLWQELLNKPEIGINDNFFHLGGDSIKAIQLSSRMQKSGFQVDLNTLFRHPTIKSLSTQIKTTNQEPEQGAVIGAVPLTPIQHAFFNAQHPEPDHYNQSVMLFSKNGLAQEHLKNTLDQLCQHHDALRMSFEKRDGTVAQGYGEEARKAYVFSSYDLRKSTDVARDLLLFAEKIQQSLSIENGPLLHCGHFQTTHGDYLLLVVHHLVIDGVSWRVMLEDFVALYLGFAEGSPVQLPAKTSSYQEWAKQLEVYSNSPELLIQLDYWRNIVETPVSTLPKDGKASQNNLAVTRVQSMQLSKELTGKLVSQVNGAYNTQINDILLTALSLAINQWNGADQVRVHLEGHGREALFDHVNLNRTVGWFTSLFPVLLPVKKPGLLGDTILGIKKALDNVPDKGIGYGILNHLSEYLHDHSLSLDLTPEIVFNYMGQFDQELGDDFLVHSPLPTGRNKSNSCSREQVLGINGSITDGRLILHFDYNHQEFSDNTITGFVGNIQRQLERIIHHCSRVPLRASKPAQAGSAVEKPYPPLGLLLNAEKREKVFAFPSLYGMAIGYSALARALDDACMVGYDFVDESQWRERYYEATKAHQPEGPYVFFGYSGGAILAYEMALFFEAKGESVSDLILVDQAPLAQTEFISKEALNGLADDMLNPSDEVLNRDPFGQVLLNDPVLKNSVRRGIIAYKSLLSELKTEGSVSADIHLLLAEEAHPGAFEDKLSWDRFTKGNVQCVQGSGSHRKLFVSPCFEENMTHLKHILHGILTKASCVAEVPRHIPIQ